MVIFEIEVFGLFVPVIRNGCGLADEQRDAGGDGDADGIAYWAMSWPWIRFFTCKLRRSRMCSLEFDVEFIDGIRFDVDTFVVAVGPDAVRNICGIDINKP